MIVRIAKVTEMKITPLIVTYAILAVVALVATWSQNIAFMSLPDNGGPLGFLRMAYVNSAAASLSNDLFLVAGAAMIFMIVEARRVGVRYVWVYVVLSFVVAISVMLPLFLIARELRLARASG